MHTCLAPSTIRLASVPDKDDDIAVVANIVPQMVTNAPAGAHAGTRHDDRAADFIQSNGFSRFTGEMQSPQRNGSLPERAAVTHMTVCGKHLK